MLTMPSNDEFLSYFPEPINVSSDVPIVRSEASSLFIDQDSVTSTVSLNQTLYLPSKDILSRKATYITVTKLAYYVKDTELMEHKELEGS